MQAPLKHFYFNTENESYEYQLKSFDSVEALILGYKCWYAEQYAAARDILFECANGSDARKYYDTKVKRNIPAMVESKWQDKEERDIMLQVHFKSLVVTMLL